MGEFNTPKTEAEFERNFAQIKPRMSDNQAYFESARCLFCYDAPCVQACPTGIDIPLFIKQIHSKNTFGAARTIYESNVFGYSCGKVCPTEVLCEGACVYNHQEVPPIEIGRLQSFATGSAMDSGKSLFAQVPSNGRLVAVVGAGPAGLAFACEMRRGGYEVDVFEAKAKPGGLTVFGVAPYKITNEEVVHEMAYLEREFGFRVHYNHAITSAADLSALEQKYEAIFLGIGLGATSRLGLPGEDLPGVEGAVEFVERLRMEHHRVSVPKRVVVLGGGNTAMDAASESARMGAEQVILAYRRPKEEMGAYDFEYDLARQAGVKGLFEASPIEILGPNQVTGVRFVRTTMQNGRPEPVPGSEFVVEADGVIKATGQGKQLDFLGLIPGLELDAKGCIVADPVTFQSGNPKYYAAGDAVSGGQEVVNAVANGKKAAQALQKRLG
jgi:glutamate synthase (NADPH/NADH) small chain